MFNEFLKSKVDVFASLQSNETLQELILDMLMEFVKFPNANTFHSALYQKLSYSIVKEHAKVDHVRHKKVKLTDVKRPFCTSEYLAGREHNTFVLGINLGDPLPSMSQLSIFNAFAKGQKCQLTRRSSKKKKIKKWARHLPHRERQALKKVFETE
ncbi:hypothetical protein Fmac_014175 [Flemingia macrophylla]|uniref:Ribosomal protein S7 n=1 Tax=Flemingia macrophylla TaxID=520843 RepID=A0ABD1MB39_9FABA